MKAVLKRTFSHFHRAVEAIAAPWPPALQEKFKMLMKVLGYIKDKFPFELKRGTSIASVIIALLFTGFLTRLGGILLDKTIALLKPYLPTVWGFLVWIISLKFEMNFLSAIVFVVFLFPIYRKIDRLLLSRSENEIIFKDDFDSGNKGWALNYWGSNDPIKTNRIENSTMIFEATEVELHSRKKEFGAYFDLRNGIYTGNNYEISCKVKAIDNTTMQFSLWLHDTHGSSSSLTPMRTPNIASFEIIKLNFTATGTQAIRIHLHNKAGAGQILVDNVLVKKL